MVGKVDDTKLTLLHFLLLSGTFENGVCETTLRFYEQILPFKNQVDTKKDINLNGERYKIEDNLFPTYNELMLFNLLNQLIISLYTNGYLY